MTYLAVTETDTKHHVVQVDAECAALWRVVGTFPKRADAVEFRDIKNGKTAPKAWVKLDLSDEQRAEIIRRCGAGEARATVGAEFGLTLSQVQDLLKRARAKERAQRAETPAGRSVGADQHAEPNVADAAVGVSAGCGGAEGRAGNSTQEAVVATPASRPSDGYDSPKALAAAGIKPGPQPTDDCGDLSVKATADKPPAEPASRQSADASATPTVSGLYPTEMTTLNAAKRIKASTFRAVDIADITKQPTPTVAANLSTLTGKGLLRRVERGVYALPQAAGTPPKSERERAVEEHIAKHGTMSRPDFGDPEINEIYEPLRVRGHSLVRLRLQGATMRPYSLNHSPGLTKAELLQRARSIIATEKPLAERKVAAE